ncbi:hypothetical protein JCM9957A_21980 [Kineosporia succinea]
MPGQGQGLGDRPSVVRVHGNAPSRGSPGRSDPRNGTQFQTERKPLRNAFPYTRGLTSGRLVERKQQQARQRIVRAAAELFAAHGFDGVSVSDIAERAEVGRTTFFRHFGDKQEVVFAHERELLGSLDADAVRATPGGTRTAAMPCWPFSRSWCGWAPSSRPIRTSTAVTPALVAGSPELQARSRGQGTAHRPAADRPARREGLGE